MANKPLQSIKFPGLADTYTIPQVDNTLTQTGAAADAKKTGDEIADLKSDLGELTDLTTTDKDSLVDAINEVDADLSETDRRVLASYPTNTASGGVASFADGADDIPVKSLVVNIEPNQSGSGDPSPTNVRPISGWTGATVTRCGKNLFDADNATVYTRSLSASEWAYTSVAKSCAFACIPNTTYTLSIGSDASYSGVFRVGFYTSDLPSTSDTTTLTPSTVTVLSSYATITTTSPSGAKYMIVQLSASSFDEAIGYLQVDKGSTATDYEAYNGTTYTVDWTTEAGTVYGGTLDVTSGVLTVDRTSVGMNMLTWYHASGSGYDYMYTSISTAHTVDNADVNMMSSIYAVVPFSERGTHTTPILTFDSANHILQARNTGYSDASAFTTSLSEAQLVYELATPQTYQLTPTEVTTLLGLNNIWADTGDVEVDYRADTKLYIENLTAPTEDDMVANTNIPDATYFMVGNNLYLSTTTIPAGDTINPGTNCTLMNLASALNALNS